MGNIVEPSNKDLISGLSRQEQAEYARQRAAAEKIATENPGLKTEVFTEYFHDWIEGAKKNHDQIIGIREEDKKQGARSYQGDLEKIAAQNSRKSREDFVEKKLPKYGKDGVKAMKLLGDELHKNPADHAIEQFYDKGKPQWGGIAGGLIVGLLAMSLLGGMGSMWGIIGGLIGLLAGGWLGNKTEDFVSEKINGGTPEPKPQPGERGKAREKDGGEEKGAAASEPEIMGPATPEDLGTMTPPVTGQAASRPVKGKGRG